MVWSSAYLSVYEWVRELIAFWFYKCSYLCVSSFYCSSGVCVYSISVFVTWRTSTQVYVLPGQGVMLHSWYSCAGPRQGWPPYLGSGLLQVLFRLRIPRLQSLLHWDQELQDDQPPFTVWPEILPRRSTSPIGKRVGRNIKKYTTVLCFGIVYRFPALRHFP